MWKCVGVSKVQPQHIELKRKKESVKPTAINGAQMRRLTRMPDFSSNVAQVPCAGPIKMYIEKNELLDQKIP